MGNSSPPSETIARWAGRLGIAKTGQLERTLFRGNVMSDSAVLRSTQGRIGILTVNNPPVNALAAAVRDGIKDGIEAFGKDANVDAIILIGSGRTFIAGADIREFGKPRTGANLNDVITNALSQYVADVRSGVFPSEAETYPTPPELA